MPTGLVEQHATAALLDDDGQCPAGCRAGLQLGERHARGIAGECLHIDGIEHLEAHGLACALEAGLHTRVGRGHHAHAHQRPHLFVFGQHTVGVRDEDAAAAVAVAGRHLHDRRPSAARGIVDTAQQVDLGGLRDAVGILLDRVHLRGGHTAEGHGAHPATALAGSGSRSLGSGSQARFAEIGRMGEAGGVALHHPDSGAAVAAAGDLFDAAVIEASRGGALVLHEHFREVGPGACCGTQNPGERVLIDHGESVPVPRPGRQPS